MYKLYEDHQLENDGKRKKKSHIFIHKEIDKCLPYLPLDPRFTGLIPAKCNERENPKYNFFQ